MAKFKLAVWRGRGLDVAGFRREVVDAWAAAALGRSEVTGLVLHRQVGGPAGEAVAASEATPPDAVLSLWIDGAENAAFQEELATSSSGWLPAGAGRLDAWRVNEVRAKVYDRSWPDGVPSPGVTQYTLVRPAPDRSPADCSRHWRERHVPLALRIHIGLWNYTQDHVVETLTPAGGDLLGHAALHFRSQADLRDKLFDSEAGAKEIYADIPRFMSLEDSQTALMTEVVLRTPAEHTRRLGEPPESTPDR
jgi:uncharacterized protein (TIGR02118 family)